ncbi:Starvation-inducible outer membrane lipoprotein [Shimia marina]|uniref:Lipoprotein n=2 Tax=Shimia marina TaxID=321267 RepID=A0A0P1ES07_9RHOB|nr:hypothetical protein SHM7688_02761 [Shimia marina]SFD80171.1 Starvation-inducible outer membrane lipoprotein [Shimia marina]
MMRILNRLLCVLAAVFLAGCVAVPDEALLPDQVGLAQAIVALDPAVDPEEAARVAQISYSYSLQLREEYNVTDGPLLHNAKVNQGLRPRGLCWQWADDLEARLWQEDLKTLTLHRAIANHDNIRIEHSTVVISAKGDSMAEGIVLDPWRYGGRLYWSEVVEDSRYNWEERAQVFALKKARQ